VSEIKLVSPNDSSYRSSIIDHVLMTRSLQEIEKKQKQDDKPGQTL
jgi:hypothetical protein